MSGEEWDLNWTWDAEWPLKAKHYLETRHLRISHFAVLRAVELTSWRNLTVELAEAEWNASSNAFTSFPWVARHECESALDELLRQGFLQVIDKIAVDQIRSFLAADRALGPTEEIPKPGGVDFTMAGAELFTEIEASVFGCYYDKPWPRACRFDITDGHFQILGTSRRILAEDDLDGWWETEGIKIIDVSNPRPIGPWRDHWWRKIPRGFLIDVHYAENSAK